MRLQKLVYRADSGWSDALPSTMDGAGTLVLAFAAPCFAQDWAPFQSLSAALPQSLLVGCSSAGEISGSDVLDDSISVVVAQFKQTRLRPVTTGLRGVADSCAAGERLAAQLAPPLDGEPLRSVFVLSDGLSVNGTGLSAGLARGLPQGVVVTGGLAGDGGAFLQTWLVEPQGPRARSVCAVGFYGEQLRIGHGCDGGWHDFGPERRITRAEGNVLFELDGKPALDLYKTYLGDLAAGLPGTALLFPLAVRRDGAASGKLVRTVLGVDEDRRSLTFAGDMPQGGIARLMRANADQLIDSAGRAARQAMQIAGLSDQDKALVISISCVGRRLVLGERTEEEVETVAESAPAMAAHLGLYSYGEIAPGAPGSCSELHNQTMTVTVLGEAA